MTILLFTGWSAAGKSTIARRLGEDWEMPVVRAREVLHKAANKRGFTRIWYWLAANGIEEVLNEGLLMGLEEIRARQGTCLEGRLCRVESLGAKGMKGEDV